MAREDLAQAITRKLGGELPAQTLFARSNAIPQSWSKRCSRTGLRLDPSLRIKGPHLWAPDLVRELFPRGELRFQWCPGNLQQPVQGSVYLDEFMYGDGRRCGKAENIPLIKRLNNMEGRGRIYLKGVCHTLLERLPELGLFLEVDEVELTHPEYPLARPAGAMFLRTVDLHVLPLPKERKRRIRASLVFDPPNRVIRHILDGLHEKRAGERAYAERADCTSLLPGKASVVLNFSYFDSPIVKKSKGLGYAEFELQLLSFQSGEWELKELRKLHITVSEFPSPPPQEFTISSLGSHQIRAVLDGVNVSEIQFVTTVAAASAAKVAPKIAASQSLSEASGGAAESGARACPIVVEPQTPADRGRAAKSINPGVLHLPL